MLWVKFWGLFNSSFMRHLGCLWVYLALGQYLQCCMFGIVWMHFNCFPSRLLFATSPDMPSTGLPCVMGSDGGRDSPKTVKRKPLRTLFPFLFMLFSTCLSDTHPPCLGTIHPPVSLWWGPSFLCLTAGCSLSPGTRGKSLLKISLCPRLWHRHPLPQGGW